MLQQTQVNRVVPAYEAFLDRFPTPASFAAAAPGDVIDAWGGLGYLRRARNLHAAARTIAVDGWPDDLTVLPGVGPYTAAAIAAFAGDEPVAAVDINLRRVISRWDGRLHTETTARERGSELVDQSRPGDWNQAMMDLGATLCRPSPRCDACPVVAWCADPTIEVRGGRQGTFVGSIRQARAAVLKALVDCPRRHDELVESTGLDASTVGQAIVALEAEGAIVRRGELLELG